MSGKLKVESGGRFVFACDLLVFIGLITYREVKIVLELVSIALLEI